MVVGNGFPSTADTIVEIPLTSNELLYHARQVKKECKKNEKHRYEKKNNFLHGWKIVSLLFSTSEVLQ